MSNRPPNIIWYCTDQQRFDTIAALGNPYVHTPHLDRLVREGVAFTHAFCQCPICTPSRASFLTGKYPSTVHVNTNGNTYFPPDEMLITRHLAENGYTCGLTGKLHLAGAARGPEPRINDGYSFFRYSHAPRDNWPTGHDYANWLRDQGLDPSAVLTVRSSLFGGLIEPSPDHDNVPPHLHQTTWCSEQALQFVQAQHDRPWLLSINPYDPHPPYNPPWEFYRRFDPPSLPGPHCHPSDLEQQRTLAGIDFQSTPQSPEAIAAKKIQAAYYAMIELIDEQFGRILELLDRTGQRERTVVIFMSDHGEALGDHGLTQKGCRFFEGLVRVPLIISWPGHILEGARSDALVELLDVAPTILDVVGLPQLPGTQGRSLLPLLTGQASLAEHRTFIRSEYYDAVDLPHHSYGTMYRDRRHKLVTYHGTGLGELYDLQEDPREFTNLWDNPASQDVKMALLIKSYDAAIATLDYGPPRVMPY
ncbi:MAG: sulfatase-like hydrolase/transferase [Chloroflexi bacterium]|nr:sulfatase-like hydrolase/transferase [Chloroflexota bacterium]